MLETRVRSTSTGGGASIGGLIIGGTQGSVLFVDASGNLGQDNANFFWADSTNRLGIGTNSPDSPLHVIGNAHVSGLTIGTEPADSIYLISSISVDSQYLRFGEGLSNNLEFSWDVTANRGQIQTFGYTDNLEIDGLVLKLQSRSFLPVQIGDDTETFPILGFNFTSRLITNDEPVGLTLIQNAIRTGAAQGYTLFMRANTSLVAPSIVASGNILHTIMALGFDNTNYVEAAKINFGVDGTPGTADMPGYIEMFTTADGASTGTSRFKLFSTGNINLGSSITWNEAITRLSIIGSETITVSGTSAFLIEQAGGTDVFLVNTTTPGVTLTGTLDVTGITTIGGGFGSTGTTLDSDGDISTNGVLTISSGGETFTITANSPANYITLSCDSTSNLYIDSGGDIILDMFGSGAGLSNLFFYAGGSATGASVSDLGYMTVKRLFVSEGAEILTIISNSPSNYVRITTNPTSNLELESGGDIDIDAFNTSSLHRFQKGGTLVATLFGDASFEIGTGTTAVGKSRLALRGGTATTTGDWAASAGWGASATVSAVTGNDSRGTVTVTTNALDTPTANPTITLTFKDGTFTSAPFALVNMDDTSTGLITATVSCHTTATTLVIQFDGTPTALSALTYKFNYIVIG